MEVHFFLYNFGMAYCINMVWNADVYIFNYYEYGRCWDYQNKEEKQDLSCDTHQWANPEQQHPIGKVSDMNIYQMNEWFSSSLGYTAHIPALCRSPSILPAF